jgi:MerR family transcriptional regulator, mercuric resistance operon regulatory protein
VSAADRGAATGPVLRAGRVAEAAGVNRETLRYYERRGLLPTPSRSPGGHRLYPAEAVTVLRVIKAAQRLGFTLDEVADLLRMGQHRHGRTADAGLQARRAPSLTRSSSGSRTSPRSGASSWPPSTQGATT